jgi:hypothetical protein
MVNIIGQHPSITQNLFSGKISLARSHAQIYFKIVKQQHSFRVQFGQSLGDLEVLHSDGRHPQSAHMISIFITGRLSSCLEPISTILLTNIKDCVINMTNKSFDEDVKVSTHCLTQKYQRQSR